MQKTLDKYTIVMYNIVVKRVEEKPLGGIEMKKVDVMEMLKARKIGYHNDFKDNIVIRINEYNEEKVCDFMDEMHAYEDAEGYTLECEDGVVYTDLYY